MTFAQARNVIAVSLEEHIGCQVNLSNQIAERPEYPYCYYSVLASRISNHYFGLHEMVQREDGAYELRSEQVTATMSFTFCSQNRETEDGYIFGEDEALSLAEKAHGFFLLYAHRISTPFGDIVIVDTSNVANRTGFLVEDTVRRYGFDVKFSYVRVDERPATTVAVAHFIGTIQNKKEEIVSWQQKT